MPLTATTKILIALGIVVFVFVIGISAFLVWMILFPGKPSPADEAKIAEGREFAKTTDQQGCITEGVKRARQIGFFDIDKKVAHKYFVAGCLQNSRPTPGFCDEIPGFWNFKGKEWEQAQCEKVGLNPLGTACEIVYEEQIDFCSGHYK